MTLRALNRCTPPRWPGVPVRGRPVGVDGQVPDSGHRVRVRVRRPEPADADALFALVAADDTAEVGYVDLEVANAVES
jgi:hypothetical protein